MSWVQGCPAAAIGVLPAVRPSGGRVRWRLALVRATPAARPRYRYWYDTIPYLYPLARAGFGLVYRAVATHVPRVMCRGTPRKERRRRRGRASWRDARPAVPRPPRPRVLAPSPRSLATHVLRGIYIAGARRRPRPGDAPPRDPRPRSLMPLVVESCAISAARTPSPRPGATKRNTITPRPTKTPSASCPS